MTECTCAAKDMPFGRCCKFNIDRRDFERWYDAQPDWRIEPWDVWKAAAKHAQEKITKDQ